MSKNYYFIGYTLGIILMYIFNALCGFTYPTLSSLSLSNQILIWIMAILIPLTGLTIVGRLDRIEKKIQRKEFEQEFEGNCERFSFLRKNRMRDQLRKINGSIRELEVMLGWFESGEEQLPEGMTIEEVRLKFKEEIDELIIERDDVVKKYEEY